MSLYPTAGGTHKKSSNLLTATLCISYSATIYCSLQSIHNTFISFVALNELPQHGQMYFLVLDGFLVFGAIGVPFPLVPPVNPPNESCPVCRSEYLLVRS